MWIWVPRRNTKVDWSVAPSASNLLVTSRANSTTGLLFRLHDDAPICSLMATYPSSPMIIGDSTIPSRLMELRNSPSRLSADLHKTLGCRSRPLGSPWRLEVSTGATRSISSTPSYIRTSVVFMKISFNPFDHSAARFIPFYRPEIIRH